MGQLRIIVADDDPPMAACIADMVQDVGYEVEKVITTGGIETIRYCQEHMVDVVITDVHMPELNGINVLKTLRSRPAALRPFLIFVSGAFAESDPLIDLARPDVFLSKPLRREEIGEALAQAEKSLSSKPA